ncbi:MAG: carbon-nitrogen hydrolase family protein [Candidatus Hydrogenedentes bacterium]|nr:carbon-nitrogen hydrolase family protein [Candidatus Hydrogenedentota bacterium]
MARKARISAIKFGGSREQTNHVAASVGEACALIDQAALDEPDLIALPECFSFLGWDNHKMVDSAEPLDGPTVTAIAAKAREHHAYIVCPIVLAKDGKFYNASILLDRRGEVMGAYYKMFPTTYELDEGITPGEKAWVAHTDFGKVGLAICFDLNFRPVAESIAEQGAELVVFSSMYRGGISARIWAYDFGWYFVSSTPSEMSHFCDPFGRVLGDLWDYQPVMTREINLDFQILHIDTNSQQWEAIRRKYGRGVSLDIVGPEGVFMLTSESPEVSAMDIVREFGMETRRDYFARATRRRNEALALGSRV